MKPVLACAVGTVAVCGCEIKQNIQIYNADKNIFKAYMNSAMMIGFSIMGTALGEAKIDFANIGPGIGMILGAGLGVLIKKYNLLGFNSQH